MLHPVIVILQIYALVSHICFTHNIESERGALASPVFCTAEPK